MSTAACTRRTTVRQTRTAAFACTAFATTLGVVASQPTALERYVSTPDPAYAWKLLQTVEADGYRTFILEMTSQNWLTTNEVNRTTWKHWLTIIRPQTVQHETALLFIGGGSNEKPAPTSADAKLVEVAKATKSVVAELRLVPNQPLVFVGDGQRRDEDALIAYTWDRFLRTGDERWPARLPMTKSAVRALDTITAFCGGPEAGGIKVNQFVVAGGSKRGWTTWTTAITDPRVVAIVPVVIDMLNLQKSFIHHFECYGFYAPAVDDYTAMGIMEWWGTPELERLLAIVEPYNYRERLTLPKFLINATGDQFFLPDSSQFYFDDLTGPKDPRYVPNADHSLKDTDAFSTLASCYHAVLNHTPLPEFRFTNLVDGTIRVETRTTPTSVRLWQASNPDARDFRLETIGKAWSATDLKPESDGVYLAKVPTPGKGWTAFLIELTYANPGAPAPFKFTTGVRVLPDTTPFKYQPPARHPLAGQRARRTSG